MPEGGGFQGAVLVNPDKFEELLDAEMDGRPLRSAGREAVYEWRGALAALSALVEAAEPFCGDQSSVDDRRIGNHQPVTADEIEALNRAVEEARAVLEEQL
jgi:hypothetical protein